MPRKVGSNRPPSRVPTQLSEPAGDEGVKGVSAQLPADLYRKVVKIAARRQRSIAFLIVESLTALVAADDKSPKSD